MICKLYYLATSFRVQRTKQGRGTELHGHIIIKRRFKVFTAFFAIFPLTIVDDVLQISVYKHFQCFVFRFVLLLCVCVCVECSLFSSVYRMFSLTPTKTRRSRDSTKRSGWKGPLVTTFKLLLLKQIYLFYNCIIKNIKQYDKNIFLVYLPVKIRSQSGSRPLTDIEV